MNEMKLLVLSVLYVSNFLSHGMEIKPTQRETKIANVRLLHAAAMGYTLQVQQLLMEGIADVNTHTISRCTPFYFACLNNHTSIAIALIEAYADVNAEDRYGETSLIYAVKNKNIALINALVCAQAQVNVCDKENKSLLRLAVESYDIGIVKILIDNGSAQKDEALLVAADMYDTSCRCYQCNEKNNICFDITKLLIKSGVNVNTQTIHNYRTPLMLACFKNNSAAALVLIEAGADVTRIDKDGETAFIGAVRNENIELIYALIKAGADVNVYGRYGILAIALAIESGRAEIRMAVINPVAKLHVRKKIETLLMIYNRGNSWLSFLPQEIVKVIITFAYPEFAMDSQLIGEIHPQIIVDTIPLEILTMLIISGIVNQDNILGAWHKRVASIVQSLEEQTTLNNNAIQQFATDVLTKITILLT